MAVADAGSAAAPAEAFQCATSLFSFVPPGGGGGGLALNVYALSLTPTDEGYEAELRVEVPHDYPDKQAGSVLSRRTLQVSGTVGNDLIELAFEGGQLRLTALRDAAAGVLQGTARFGPEDIFGDRDQLDEVSIACWSASGVTRFHYDPTSGRCLDADGVEGRQAVPVPMLRATRNGECAALSAANRAEDPPTFDDAERLNGIDVAYPHLVGWDLRGADLWGFSLYFALLLDADLRGAQLSGFLAGYHNITGLVDEHTTGLETLLCREEPGDERLLCCTVGGPCE